MKVKTISRNPDHYMRETKRDIHKVPRNYNPSLHPFEGLREYTRALNAVKLDRVFAKPFIGSLDGHSDGVFCLTKHPRRLSLLASGSYDGEVRFWDLPSRTCIRHFQAHDGFVRGITFGSEGEHFLTAGDDRTIKLWNIESPGWGEEEEPTNTYISRTVIIGISHHQTDPMFATCGEICQLWVEDRNEPVKTFSWSVDSTHDISFNPVERNLLASCANDRSIILHDTRGAGPVRKVIMSLKANRISWNPMEAYIFTCANEDYNLYSFDTRKLNLPLFIHQGHISAVTAVDYAPTGKEFVSGSYDRTIRIFKKDQVYSRDVYHTRRMQRLTSVLWSLDNKYVMCGSDEMNIRMWKARASEKLGVMKPREKAALNYNEALKQKYGMFPQVKRIAQYRHTPKYLHSTRKRHAAIHKNVRRKEFNIERHSKPGSFKIRTEKEKAIVEEQE